MAVIISRRSSYCPNFATAPLILFRPAFDRPKGHVGAKERLKPSGTAVGQLREIPASLSAARPAGVRRTARVRPLRESHYLSSRVLQIPVPRGPARWKRRSVESMHDLPVSSIFGGTPHCMNKR